MSAPAIPPSALSVADLTLARGGRLLFEGLAVSVPAGTALIVRGPNGAGKTSLLLAVAGAIRPRDGSVRYRERGAELDLRPNAHLLLPQNGLKPRLTVGENLGFWHEVNGGTGLAAGVALERVGLGGLDAIEAGHLSTGQSRRLALARLLVSRRAVWLLDEPTATLDTEGEALAATLIAEHCAAGGIAVIATHHDLPARGMRAQVLTIADGRATLAGVLR